MSIIRATGSRAPRLILDVLPQRIVWSVGRKVEKSRRVRIDDGVARALKPIIIHRRQHVESEFLDGHTFAVRFNQIYLNRDAIQCTVARLERISYSDCLLRGVRGHRSIIVSPVYVFNIPCQDTFLNLYRKSPAVRIALEDISNL